MQILSTFVQGKVSDQLCEDIVFHNEDFAAVIDGATDKTGRTINGVTGGRFVAETLKTVFAVANADLSFLEWVELCEKAVKARLTAFGWPDDLQSPAASVVAYSRHTREIWRVGDCNYRIIHPSFGGLSVLGSKLVDQLNGERRAAVVRQALLAGASISDLMKADPGKEAIMPYLRQQYRYANNESEALGYPVMNGDPVPVSLLEAPVRVPDGATIILTSDGFTDVRDTLEETLAAQQLVYEADPLLIGMNGGAPCVKGMPNRNGIHDDRSWLSIMI